jgi:hypothetical protein
MASLRQAEAKSLYVLDQFYCGVYKYKKLQAQIVLAQF